MKEDLSVVACYRLPETMREYARLELQHVRKILNKPGLKSWAQVATWIASS